MIFELNISGGYQIFKFFHSLISFTFLVIAIWLIIRSSIGVIKTKPYTKLDKSLSYGFIINLYLQLIFGIILFTNIRSSEGFDYLGAGGSLKVVSKRLWPVEHIVLMLFALFIANLGLILSSKAKESKEKHKKVLIYYITSIVLIIFSLGVIYVL